MERRDKKRFDEEPNSALEDRIREFSDRTGVNLSVAARIVNPPVPSSDVPVYKSESRVGTLESKEL